MGTSITPIEALKSAETHEDLEACAPNQLKEFDFCPSLQISGPSGHPAWTALPAFGGQGPIRHAASRLLARVTDLHFAVLVAIERVTP